MVNISTQLIKITSFFGENANKYRIFKFFTNFTKFLTCEWKNQHVKIYSTKVGIFIVLKGVKQNEKLI